MILFAWIISILSLLAVWLNIQKRELCFWIWGFTNAAWVWVDFAHGIYSQAALQLVYFFLSVYGIIKWRYDDAGRKKNHG